LGIIVALILLLFIALQFQQVQNFLGQKAAQYLEDTLNTEVEIAGLTTDFRNSIVLKGVYVEDQQQDTLWYSQRIGVDINLFSLLNQEVNISSFVLSNATAHIQTTLPDSTSNYDFILEAFATDTTVATEPVDTTNQGAWAINIGTVTLEDIFLTMQDEVTGSHIRARIGSFVTQMEEIDLERSVYRIDEIDLRNTYASYVQTKLPPETEEEAEPLEMKFGLNLVNLANVRLNYENQVAGQKLALNVGESSLRADNIDLDNAKVNLQEFVLRNTEVLYAQQKYTPKDSLALDPEETVAEIDESVEEKQGEPVNWVVTLNDLDVTGLDVKVINENVPRQEQGLDYNHLAFSDITIDVKDLFYSLNRITADIQQVRLREQSGFKVEQFSTDLTFDSTMVELANLNLETGNSRIRRHLELRYPSLDALADNVAALFVQANINNSHIGLRDILYFQPDLRNNPAFRQIADTDLFVDGEIVGPVDDLSIRGLRVSGLKDTELRAGGNIKGLPDMDQLYLNLVINQFATTRTDIKALAPAGTLPPDIQLPPNIRLTGQFKGSLTNFDTEASLVSTYGNVKADVQMRPKAGVHQGAYEGEVRVTNLDLGKILQQDTTFGQVTMQATVDGYGITPEHIHANINATIQEFGYNQYQYNNILIRGTAEHDMFTGFAAMKDDNLVFAFDGTVNMEPELPLYNFTLDLEQADLQALNLYQDDLKLEGKFVADMRGNDLKDLAGTLAIRNLVIQDSANTYKVDSVQVALDNTPQQMDMQVKSDLLLASFTSGNNLEELPEAINRYIDNYIRLPGADKRPAYELQDLAFEIKILNTDLFEMLVPDLTRLEVGPIAGNFDSQGNQLQINAAVPNIVYAGMNYDSLTFRVRGNEERLAYTLRLQEISDSSLLVQGITLAGSAQNDNLNLRFSIDGKNPETEVLALGGVMRRLEDAYRFSFDSDDIILNENPWDVSQDNFLQFGDGQIYANNIRFARNGSYFAINSIGNLGDDGLPMKIAFNDFALEYIVDAVQREDSLLTGTLDGELTLVDVTKNFTFTADLVLKNLTFQTHPVGDIKLEANNAAGDRYNVAATLTGQGNEVTMEGYYVEQEVDNLINLDVALQPLSLASVEPFTFDLVKDMAGQATGRLAVTGSLGAPEVRGRLYFDQAAFNPSMLNTVLRLQDETLVFNEQGISFPNFTLTDANNNEAVVTGQILTETYTDFAFDLNVRANNFLVMNSTVQNNDFYYGTLTVDSRLTIGGDLNLPVVRGSVRVLDGTSLNVVVPNEDPSVVSREGIVEFVDMTNQQNGLITQTASDTASTQFTGMDLSVTVEVTEGSSFTVIIDPVAGDFLEVSGNGVITTGIDPSGLMTLSGRYEISEGSYRMTFYDLVKREFEIKTGSNIVWSGDPLDAIVDITAIYTTDASPMELVGNQIAGMEQNEKNRFRQQLPFQVFLSMEGELMEPVISFDIQLPEEERSALEGMPEARLMMLRQEPNELNKQVFALLILGRFIAEDPFASTGGGLASTARNSVSQVLSQQLNQLTDEYLGGLGLEVGVESYEDFSTGTAEGRTEVNLALRQQLLDDRLIIRIGGDIDIEGERRRQNTMSDFAGDVAVEYLLTEDGRLRVKAFRRREYEGFLEGDVQETGLSLIFMREYNNFAELFKDVDKKKNKERN
jgi:translocation and assembly module TamB